MAGKTTDDGGCAAFLILAGLLALFVAAPRLSQEWVAGGSGAFLAVLGGLYLGTSAAAPFWPTWGAIVVAPWGVYALAEVGYFTVVGGWFETMTQWSDPAAGIDGFVLSLLVIALMLVMALALYLAVPVAAAAVAGFAANLPAILVRQAQGPDAPARQSRPGTPGPTQQQSRQAPRSAATGTAHTTRRNRRSTDTPAPRQTRGHGEVFAEPLWRDGRGEAADRSIARRRGIAQVTLAIYWLLAPVAAFIGLVPFAAPTVRLGWWALVWLAASGAALLHWRTGTTVNRDIRAWALPEDDYTRRHRATVAEANRWAAAVHPDDLREGRAAVGSILAASEAAMNDARRLAEAARRESEAAGPGWVPPSQRELHTAEAELEQAAAQMRELRRAAQDYVQVQQHIGAQLACEEALRALAEDAAVLDEAAATYLGWYSEAWHLLAHHDAAAGRPRPDRFRADPRIPDGIRPAPLTAALEALAGRAEAAAEDAQDRADADPRLAAARDRDRRAAGVLRMAAALTQAASARLVLAGAADPARVGSMDEQNVNDLIDRIRARSSADLELQERWGESTA